MARSSSRDPLIDEIGSWNVGMPVRPMQELLRRGPAAVAPLVSLVAGWRGDEDHDLLWSVVLLGELRAAEAIEPLADVLGHPDSLELPMAAAEALAKIGAPAVPSLVERSRAGGTNERIWSYAALGWIGGDAAYRALIEALERDAELVDVAALALADAGREDAIPLIYRALQRSEPCERLELENALRELASPPARAQPFQRDWRLRYRRRPNLGMPEPAWPLVPAAVQDKDELLRQRPPLPVRPLEEILSAEAEADGEPELCDCCGAPVEKYTGLPACPETAVSTALLQVEMVERAREDGYEDLFDYLDELDAAELSLLEGGEPEEPGERELWEDERTEIHVARRTCVWLIERGVESVDRGRARLLAEAARLGDRYGDPQRALGAGRPRGAERTRGREPKVGRNDPCPCGSGRKYKRCCGAAGAARTSGAGSEGPRPGGADESDEGLYRRCVDELLKFARRSQFRDEVGAALQQFAAFGAEPSAEQSEALFMDWLLLDYRPAGGPTILERYLDERGRQLPEREREFLRRLGSSHLGLYEVLEARPGTGLALRDVLSGATTDVRERTASRSLVRWDLIGARLVELENRTELAAGILAFPTRWRHELVDALEREYDRYRQSSPAAAWTDFLKAEGVELLYGRASDRLAEPPPRLLTAEGHDVLFCRAHYAVTDRAAVLAALRAEPDLHEHEDEPGSFGWTQQPGEPEAAEGVRVDSGFIESPGAEGRRSLGHIELRSDRLLLECMSRERLERGKALLQGQAGAGLRHLGDSLQDPWAAMEESRQHEQPPRDSLPPEVERELVDGYLDRHYQRWPDEPLPALDGLTPRQAVRSPTGRRRVADLVRELENSLARERRERGRAYDVGWLREELGLGPDE